MQIVFDRKAEYAELWKSGGGDSLPPNSIWVDALVEGINAILDEWEEADPFDVLTWGLTREVFITPTVPVQCRYCDHRFTTLRPAAIREAPYVAREEHEWCKKCHSSSARRARVWCFDADGHEI